MQGLARSSVPVLVASAIMLATIGSTVAQFQFPLEISPNDTILIHTGHGHVALNLSTPLAPKHAERIRMLVREKFYDGLPVYRSTNDVMVVIGDPGQGGSAGNSKYPNLAAEISGQTFTRGSVGMWHSGKADTGNSVFFIVLKDAPELAGKYTLIGSVVHGLEAIEKIERPKADRTGAAPDRISRMFVAADVLTHAPLTPPPAPTIPRDGGRP